MYRARALASAEDAIAFGVSLKMTILVGMYGCSKAVEQQGRSYDLIELPVLPLQGCEEAPWCSCVFSNIVNLDDD
jgi:hypothetical protein